ncbi:MAG: AmmeMemoRadiSam system protein B [Anaerolineae bacterium]|nr:AmmeMemoRadiSam system protein B [Anaerolineae bacterium]
MSTRPTLRPLDFQPVVYQGEQMWLLRDPLQLSDRQLIFPVALAQILPLLDGSRDLAALHGAFGELVAEQVPAELITTTLQELDDAYLLDNERARQQQNEHLAAYRAQPFRLPSLAGLGYPSAPDELNSLFARYEAEAGPATERRWRGRALISPHIDYQRGGHVYASVWRHSHAALAGADLVLILGTDHSGGPGSVTLTEVPYATPYGVLPTDPELVARLAAAIGPEQTFALELNHRHEHSVELSAVWLHYVYQQLGQAPPPVVPVLTGSFQYFVGNGFHPGRDRTLNRFVDALQAETAGRRVFVVASVDLAHVGPSFGDPFVMDGARRERLRQSDARLLDAVSTGDHARFYQEIATAGDRHRICGFAATYLMLRYLDGAAGAVVAYDHCPADEQDNSLVSICGLLLD